MSRGDALAFPVTPGTLAVKEVADLVGQDDPVILEVGANCGQTTGELLDVMPRATIFAFEPDPRAAADFRLNIGDAARLFECAVGAFDGTVLFHQSSGADEDPDFNGDWHMSGSIRRPRSHLQAWPWVRFEQRIEVPIVTLDTWASQNAVERVDFIWADVQGAESDLVQGAARLLRSTRYLYTEYSNDEWFEGQVDLAVLVRMLPGLELMRRYQWDALFRNTRGQEP
jgi:FkbM family methyltransferase